MSRALIEPLNPLASPEKEADGADDGDEFFSPGAVDDVASGRSFNSSAPPRAARRETHFRNDMYQMETPGRDRGGKGGTGDANAVKEHTSVLHAMSGVMAKEFTQLEDRCLLLLAHAHGFGEWGKVAQDLYRVAACMPEVKNWLEARRVTCGAVSAFQWH